MNSMEILHAYWIQIVSLKTVKMILSSLFLLLSFLLGDFNVAIIACGVLYMLDMICGMSIAAYKGIWDWHKLRKGVFKFILYGVAIIVGHMLDHIVMDDLLNFGARYMIILYLGITEALSILKHLANMGLHLPMKLIKRLEGIRDDLDSPGLAKY